MKINKATKRKIIVTLPFEDEHRFNTLSNILQRGQIEFKTYIISGWKKPCDKCNQYFYPNTPGTKLCDECLSKNRFNVISKSTKLKQNTKEV